MKRTYLMPIAALMLAFTVSDSDARPKARGGSTVQTNYGCATLAAGTTLRSPDGFTTKRLLMATSAWVCTLQSPSSLLGWTFVY
jgi:hypothetical protein